MSGLNDRRNFLLFELKSIESRRETLLKELNELDVTYAKQKVEENGAYFVSQDLHYLNKNLFRGYKCVPATLHVPIERNGSSIGLLRDKSFFVCEGRIYKYDASDYYGNDTDSDILVDISDKDSAKFVYETDHAIIKLQNK
ncbi:MAG: hypothetical protein WD512_14315 [Candidatus Paceibacterota bacterium]